MPEPVVRPDIAEPTARPARLLLALATIGIAFIAWIYAPPLIQHTEGTFSDDLFYLRAMLKLTILLAASTIIAFVLIPILAPPIARIKRHWREAYTYLALAAACVFQWIFVIYAGRWQFGGFDYSNLMQEGWREVLGQRPYVGFLASTPPAFNLGIKYAYQLLGVTWDANLYLTALFTCVTFLWIYWLMTSLSLSRLASILMAFAIECAAMLTLSFWWYNNITLILAAILFLSSLLYAARSRSIPAQLSYLLSLALTSLTKPNIAGLAIVGCVLFLIVVCERRLHTILLTLGAAALAIAILTLNHISIPALVTTYRGVAGERGFAAIGFSQMNDYEQYSSFFWLPVLSLPLVALFPRINAQRRQKDWKSIARSLFFFLGPFIAAYGVATNGEFRQVECTLLLAAAGVVVFGMKLGRPMLTRVFLAFLFASIVGDLYMGFVRLRVYAIGGGTFFEWQDSQNRIDSGVLKNMRVSSTMIDTERQIDLVMKEDPGPFWFGPRLDFNNAVFHLPMPEHLAAWWHPGTAFPRSEVPHLLDLWQQQDYQTLIFLNENPDDDYADYPQQFLDLIHNNYVVDDSHPLLTVYRKRPNLHPQP